MCHGVGLSVGGLERAGAAVDGQELRLLSQLIQGTAFLLLSLQQVHKQLRRLGAGQRCVPVGAHAIRQAGGGTHGHVAVRPHAAHVLVLIAQQPQQDGHRLPQGHGPLRIALAVGVASNDIPALGGQVDVPGGPVGGLYVREYRHRPVAAQFAGTVHHICDHFAELRPGQLAVRTEGAVSVAVQHPHEPQTLHRRGGVGVRQVGKPDGLRGACRDHLRGKYHDHRQQGRQDSFFHSFLPPYSARRASTGWSFDAFAAG